MHETDIMRVSVLLAGWLTLFSARVESKRYQKGMKDWALTSYYYDKDGLKTACLDAEHYLSTFSYNDFMNSNSLNMPTLLLNNESFCS